MDGRECQKLDLSRNVRSDVMREMRDLPTFWLHLLASRSDPDLHFTPPYLRLPTHLLHNIPSRLHMTE